MLIESYVPQGSILLPLYLFLFINDMLNNAVQSVCILKYFADFWRLLRNSVFVLFSGGLYIKYLQPDDQQVGYTYKCQARNGQAGTTVEGSPAKITVIPGKIPICWIMTSSNGNIYRITGPLCKAFTDHRRIPHTKASVAELWCFLWSASE